MQISIPIIFSEILSAGLEKVPAVFLSSRSLSSYFRYNDCRTIVFVRAPDSSGSIRFILVI